MSFPQHKIVIVGGGIAGLALGRALHGREMPFQIVERSLVAADGGLAVNLPGNAIRALKRLGLGDEIENNGYAFERREYRSANDRILFTVDEKEFWGTEAQPRSIRRSVLMQMLGNGLPDGSILRGNGVRTITQRFDTANLDLEDGSSVNADLIVGADGVRSKVRSTAFADTPSPGHALLADASWRFIAPNRGVDCWTVWAGREAMVLLMPISQSEVYGWAAITGRGSGGAGARADLHSAVRDMPQRVRETVEHALANPASLHHSPLEEVRMDSWHSGRTVLIGDAAHATAPVWAEGVALALEDAIVLGQCLAARQPMEKSLSSFETRRRARVHHVQKMTDTMSKAARLPFFLRNLLLPVIGPKRYAQTYEPLMADA